MEHTGYAKSVPSVVRVARLPVGVGGVGEEGRGGKGREREREDRKEGGGGRGGRESGLAELCALDFGFGQRAVGGAHSTNNPGLIPASAVYVYTCTRSWGTRTQARMASYRYTRTGTRVESGQTDESPRMCVFICTYMCVYIYIVCIHTYVYIYI